MTDLLMWRKVVETVMLVTVLLLAIAAVARERR